MGQRVVNLQAIPGQPGIILDWAGARIGSAKADSLILPGTLLEFVQSASGEWLVQPVQDATTGGSFAPKLAGIAILPTLQLEQQYVTYAVPATGSGSSLQGFPKGYAVPFLYGGDIWGAWDGNTGVAFPGVGAIQVWHSSTGANPQGVFTTKAAQTTVGAEIDSAGAYIRQYDIENLSGAYTDSFGNTNDIIAIQINLPGHS